MARLLFCKKQRPKAKNLAKQAAQADLVRRAQAGEDAAKAELIEMVRSFIWKLVNYYQSGTTASRSDCYMAGVCGLLHALTLFDPSRDVLFLTFAGWQIRSAIQKEIGSWQRNTHAPMPVYPDENGQRYQDTIPDRETPPPESAYEEPPCLQRLPERTREIIRLRFGFDGQGERTLETIADQFRISKERVRQLLIAARPVLLDYYRDESELFSTKSAK